MKSVLLRVRQLVTGGVDGALGVFRRAVEGDHVAVFELGLRQDRQRLAGTRRTLDVDAVAHIAIHVRAQAAIVVWFMPLRVNTPWRVCITMPTPSMSATSLADCATGDHRLAAADHQHHIVRCDTRSGAGSSTLPATPDALNRHRCPCWPVSICLHRFPAADVASCTRAPPTRATQNLPCRGAGVPAARSTSPLRSTPRASPAP